MNIKITLSSIKKYIFALVLLCIGLFYFSFMKFTPKGNWFFATVILLLNVYMLVQSRKNMQTFLLGIILFYFNYSAIINYYYFGESSVLSFSQCNTTEYKGISIICLYIFSVIFFLCVDWDKIEVKELASQDVMNQFVFFCLVAVLILIWYMHLNRGELGNRYQVFNKAIFEYSYILFLFALYFSKQNKLRIAILTILLVLFVLQDGYYGGRISSLEFILVFYFIFYYKYFKPKTIFMIILGAIFLFSIVSLYRISYSVNGLSVNTIIQYITNSRFSLDSASNSYYSTLCAVKGYDSIDVLSRLDNFMGFIVDTMLGSADSYQLLPALLGSYGIYNIGGCWLTGYIYFWFGIFGVLLFSIGFTMFFKWCINSNKIYGKFIFMTILITIPRWYLYTLSAFFRGILLVSVCFFVVYLFNYFGNSRRKNEHI